MLLVKVKSFYFSRSQCSTTRNHSTCSLSQFERIEIYGSLVAGVLFLSFAHSVLFSVLLVRASRVLHNKMFSHVLRAPIYFFDTNPIGKYQITYVFDYYYFKGRILNRFSKDIGFMDDILIKNFSRFFMVRTIMVVYVLIYNNF